MHIYGYMFRADSMAFSASGVNISRHDALRVSKDKRLNRAHAHQTHTNRLLTPCWLHFHNELWASLRRGWLRHLGNGAYVR